MEISVTVMVMRCTAAKRMFSWESWGWRREGREAYESSGDICLLRAWLLGIQLLSLVGVKLCGIGVQIERGVSLPSIVLKSRWTRSGLGSASTEDMAVRPTALAVKKRVKCMMLNAWMMLG